MPARVNGIGTTYIGKREVQTQQGVCESCKRPGPLSSFETRLWFTVVFIPVIRLTRKQILNYCPRCTRHRAMGVDEWKKVQTEAIGSAMAQVDANPDSPEHAVECHATMAACGKREEAAQYADAMTSRFGDNANVLMYLGGWFERTGQSARADQCFDRALAADPQHPGALRATAIGLAQDNKPREAEAKLATLRPPSKHFDPAMFFVVAEAYQRAGDHEAATRLFKLVAETTPSAAKEKAFRKAVEKSEAALGQHGSVLAPIPWFRKPVFWWSALVAAMIVGLVSLDRYFAANRELYVVNGMPEPLKIRLDGGEVVQVRPTGQLKLAANEGHHTISVIEPAVLARDQEFTIDSSITGRWGSGQVNIADPTQSAILLWEEAVYAEFPGGPGGDEKPHVAEPFLTLDSIDYKFEEFPREVRVEGHNNKVTKRRVGLEKIPPLELLVKAPELLTGESRMGYLEAHLATGADRDVLLKYYREAATEQNQLPRYEKFVKTLNIPDAK